LPGVTGQTTMVSLLEFSWSLPADNSANIKMACKARHELAHRKPESNVAPAGAELDSARWHLGEIRIAHKAKQG